MPVDRERRYFFSGFIAEIVSGFLREAAGSRNESSNTESCYFDSFENCYPLITEAGDLLFEEAKRRGIVIEGKSKHEIARELFTPEKIMRL